MAGGVTEMRHKSIGTGHCGTAMDACTGIAMPHCPAPMLLHLISWATGAIIYAFQQARLVEMLGTLVPTDEWLFGGTQGC